MITISLDEQGEFEKDSNNPAILANKQGEGENTDEKPMFIAGLIYDDGEAEDQQHVEEWIERERIRAYYKRVIADAGTGEKFVYPEALHSDGNKHRDHSVVRLVKNQVTATLAEFLEKGTYNNGQPLFNERGQKIRKRAGRYHLFVILKSADGKQKLLSDRASKLADDRHAANLYFHMASTAVNRLIFHNPLYPENGKPSVYIDVATRSTGDIDQMDAQTIQEFKEQAYRPQDNGDHQYYSIMNPDTYRTLIAQEILNSGNIGLKIEDFNVTSIQYHEGKVRMEFLYLSDSICSILGHELLDSSADSWLEQIDARVERLNPQNQNLIFGYDEIDNDFTAAWNCYEKKYYYDALSIIYDAKLKKGKFAEYYRQHLFPYLEERIRTSMTPVYFNKSVNDLSAMLTINNLDQEKLLYLMQQFEQMIPTVADKYKSTDMKNTVLYKLYDAGVSAFCHIGNAKKALEYYEKCKEFAFYVGVDAYLKTKNKVAVCLEDCFEWDKALEIARGNVTNQELASEMKRELLKKGDESDFLDEAKAISQMARIYAEKRDPQAEKEFRRALKKLERGSANYKITQSYLLHFYADMGMKDQFEDEANDYFDGRNTYAKRLRYIREEKECIHDVFSQEYALYVLIRGLFLFGQEQITNEMWNNLCSLKETLTRKNGKEPSGHPWEIIYKYLEILAFKRNDEKARKTFAELKRGSLNWRGEIIIAIEKFGEAEVADYEGDIAKRDQTTSELVKYLAENFDALQDRIFSEDGEERYRELGTYFTFMYR